MELQENDYILGYWFASDNDDNCWYQIIIKRDDKWIGQYTHRYNKEAEGENDPFSGKDEKSIYRYSLSSNMSENEVIEESNLLFDFCKIKYNQFSDMFLVQGDLKKFLEIAKTKRYLHFKEVDA